MESRPDLHSFGIGRIIRPATYVSRSETGTGSPLEMNLEDIQGLGLDTSEAEELLEKAQEMLGDDEEFVHALDYAERAKKVADNKLQSEYVKNSAEKAIEATKAQLLDLKEEGLDVGDLEEQIAQAEQMLVRENYVVAMDYISQAKDKSMGLQRKYIISSVQTNLSDTQSL